MIPRAAFSFLVPAPRRPDPASFVSLLFPAIQKRRYRAILSPAATEIPRASPKRVKQAADFARDSINLSRRACRVSRKSAMTCKDSPSYALRRGKDLVFAAANGTRIIISRNNRATRIVPGSRRRFRSSQDLGKSIDRLSNSKRRLIENR